MSNYAEHFQSTLGSAGLKVSVSSILDLADPFYSKVPEEIRAAVWLVAKHHGWTRDGIKVIMKNLMGKRYDEDTAEFVLKDLEDFSKKHPDIVNFS